MKKIFCKIRGLIFYDFGILKIRFYRKTNKYLTPYYSKQNKAKRSQNKTIIYMLDGRAYSGGISDIIKGIISMYKFSKEIGFDFKINFCYPYNLEEYFVPNLYNWHIPENEISYNSDYSIPLWIYSSYLSNGVSREFEIKYQKKILLQFIKENKTKNQFHIYTNSEWAQKDEYSSLFNELFKPAENLKKIVEFYKNKIGKEYISMTFRFQQLLGDFKEKDSKNDKMVHALNLIRKLYEKNSLELPVFGEHQLRAFFGNGDYKNKSEILTKIEKEYLIKKCIDKIIEIHTNSFPNNKILITSDSQEFINKVSKFDFIYTLSNKNVPDKYSKNERYNIFLNSYIDLLMLSEANKLFLLCTDSMYHSGFAKNASYMNNKKYREINF